MLCHLGRRATQTIYFLVGNNVRSWSETMVKPMSKRDREKTQTAVKRQRVGACGNNICLRLYDIKHLLRYQLNVLFILNDLHIIMFIFKYVLKFYIFKIYWANFFYFHSDAHYVQFQRCRKTLNGRASDLTNFGNQVKPKASGTLSIHGMSHLSDCTFHCLNFPSNLFGPFGILNNAQRVGLSLFPGPM